MFSEYSMKFPTKNDHSVEFNLTLLLRTNMFCEFDWFCFMFISVHQFCNSFMMAIHLGSNGNPSKGIKYPRVEIVVASNRPTLPLANGDERNRIISWHEHYFNSKIITKNFSLNWGFDLARFHH